MSSQGGIGPRRFLSGLADELAATWHVARRTSSSFWLAWLLLVVPSSLAGLLPLGRFALLLHCLTLLFFGVMMLLPEVLAREFRKDDQLELRERESAETVTHLPVLIVVAATPLYLVGQAILFRLVMRYLPGTLPGESWGDAWLHSLNNLLYTEVFFDFVDIFRLGLVPEPSQVLGRLLVFATRVILSLAFIRVLIILLRGAWYRAHGLGRGSDHVAAMASALQEDDWVEVRHEGRALAEGVRQTIDRLVRRLDGPGREAALDGLWALREWALPQLASHQSVEPGGLVEDALAHLAEAPDEREVQLRPAPRPSRRLAALLAMAGIVIAVALLPGWFGLMLGVAALCFFGWLLVTPRSSIERTARAGIVGQPSAERFGAAILAWSVTNASLLLLTAYLVFARALVLDPASFTTAGQTAGSREVVAFLASNLLRLQVFFSVPDIFAIGTPPIEQRPFLGSLLTFLVRVALNLGVIAPLLTWVGVGWHRAWGGSGLAGNQELAMRVEALRAGPLARELARHHAENVQEELWSLLVEARQDEAVRALVESGAFAWLEARSIGATSDARLGEIEPTAVVAAQLARAGRSDTALALVDSALSGPLESLFPAMRVRSRVHAALALGRLGLRSRALDELAGAERELGEEGAAMHPDDLAEITTLVADASTEIRSGLVEPG